MAKSSKQPATTRKPIEVLRPPLSRTFDVPTPDELMEVFEGDGVKLIFRGGSDIERMWVTVTRAGSMEHWAGTLDNEPATLGVSSRIKYGEMVQFHPYDVINIDLHRRPDQRKREQPVDSVPVNKIVRPWYNNSQIMVPLIVGVIGAAATIIAALI
jgi:hypothetical protein